LAYLQSGQYDLSTLIGRGPTGEVWRAVDRNTREGVAVKVLDAGYGADPATVDRILREQHILTAFLHPTFVRVRDVVTGEGTLALVTEFVQGWDLGRHLAHTGPLDTATAVQIATILADALAAAHDAGVVHCDLKPSNVLLEEPGGEVRLTDCRVGRLARGYHGSAAWYTNPEYAAPEVIRGGAAVPGTDVYGLGIILYEMLLGTTPYRSADPGEVIAGHIRAEPWLPATVPDPLRRLVEDCLEGEPAARPSALAMARRLRQLDVSGVPEPVREPPEVLPERLPAVVTPPPVQQMPVEPVAAPPPGRPRPAPRRPRSGGLTGVRGAMLAGGLALVVAVAVLGLRMLSPASGNEPQGGGPGSTDVGPPATLRTTPPQAPASAAPASAEGGSAFIRHWFEALSYAVGTGDTSALDASSSPSCRACADVIAFVRNAFSNGGSLRGGGYTLRNVTTDDFWSLENPRFGIVFDRSARSTVAAGGGQGDVLEGATFLAGQILLEREGERWRVLDVQTPTPLF
jgi:serine/threonine protein kinase, bacterial